MLNSRCWMKLANWKSTIQHLVSGAPLGLVPDRIHLRKVDVTQVFAARVQFVLQSIETGDEFVSRSLQGAFRIEFAFPCEINDCEEQIAYFVLDVVVHASYPWSIGRKPMPRLDGLSQFLNFFFNLRDHVAQFSPVKINPGNFRLHFLCAHQSRERVRQTTKIMFARFLSAFD